MFSPEQKVSGEEGEWSREARYQRNMADYCKELPTREETARQYQKERQHYMANNDNNEEFVDMRPYTAGSLGRDRVGTGDFTTVSQFAWDNHRMQNMREERPQGPAYGRAKERGTGMEESEEEHLKKLEELKARMMDTGDKNMSAASELLRSIEEGTAKKKCLIPHVHKPYEWDADNPNVGIPWPDVKPNVRAKGPAFDRLKNEAKSDVKQFDHFTGTWIMPQQDRNTSKKHLDLNYSPSLNAYVKGDVLSGLRSKKRHDKIVDGMDYLAYTKLDDATRAELAKQERKRRADEEYERAKQAVHERKMHRNKMTERLANLEVRKKGIGRGARPGRRPKTGGSIASSDFSVSSYGSISTASSFLVPSNDKKDKGPDILIIDHGKQEEKKEADSQISQDEIEMWEGTRVKTPLWGHFGRGTSAGYTPFARLGSASQEKFSGWMKDLRSLVSRGNSGTRSAEGEYSEVVKGEESEKEKEKEKERETFSPAYVATGGTKSGMPQSKKSVRPSGRRRNRKDRNSAPMGDDGSMIFEEQSLESLSLESSGGEEDSSMLSSLNSGKKKKRKKKMRGVGVGEDLGAMSDGGSSLNSFMKLNDDDTIVSMLSNEDSFGDGSIGSLTMMSDLTDGDATKNSRRKEGKKKKRKKQKKRKSQKYDDFDDATIGTDEGGGALARNLSAYVNRDDSEDVAPIASFEFIDDLSLSSQMGSVKSKAGLSGRLEAGGRHTEPDMHDQQRDARSDARRASRKRTASLKGGEVINESPNSSPILWEAGGMLEGEEIGNEVTDGQGGEQTLDRPSSSQKAILAAKAKGLTAYRIINAGKNKVAKRAERLESYLIKKKMWKKEWRVSGKDNYDQGVGFKKANANAVVRANSFGTRLGVAALYGLSAVWSKTAYLSYMAVFVLGGGEAASTMGLRDFLIKRSLTPAEMLTAASDGERSLVTRALTQIKDRVKVDVRDYAGKTALMCAIEASSLKLSQEELRDWSRSQRRQRIVRFLRGRGSTPDNPKVIIAMREKKYNRVLDLLLMKGADINAHCTGHVDENVTPLHLAVMGGEVKSIKWVLAKDGKVNGVTESKMTALHFAAKLGKCDAAAYLLTQDADMIARTNIGWTPLHFAAYSGGTVMVRMLLKAGSDKGLKDHKGRTAADIAALHGNRSSFECLRKWNDEGYRAKENLDFLVSKMGDSNLFG